MQCSGGTVFGVIALQPKDHQYASLMFALFLCFMEILWFPPTL